MADSKELAPVAKRRPPAAGMGRKKGVPNKTTQFLKDAILLAAEDVGEDGKGRGGLTGYCRFLAKEEPKAFAGLMGKVLPTQIAGSLDVNHVSKEQRDAAVAAVIRADA